MIAKRIRVSARRGLWLAGVLALGTFTLGACALMAQNDGPPPGGRGGGPGGRGFNPDRQVEMLTHRLNLTADQQTQVKAVLTEQRQKMEALRNAAPAASADSSQAAPNRRQQMETIRTDSDAKITALLNDDQKTKYAAMVQERKERTEQRGGGDGPPPPPPPPPGV
jgi:Spy/CpxP family protein refolding chaperone